MNNTIGLNNPLDKLYPVGSIYLTLSEANPKDLFGGVWQKIEDVFLLGSGKKALNSRGGEEEVTLTEAQMPRHSHPLHRPLQFYGEQANEGSIIGGDKLLDSSIKFWSQEEAETGGSQPHNNMPPYLTVNMWQRIE